VWPPDHPKIKSVSTQFDKIALDPRFRFFGNIMVGDHVRPAELADRYDAAIYALGAQSDRPLGIPGGDLPGSVAAVDFVGWYNAHPHFEKLTPDLSTGRAVILGNGNVALDVARILVSDRDALATTDIADHALQSLQARGVEEVLIVGRRGPLQATFTPLELRELGDLEALRVVDVIVTRPTSRTSSTTTSKPRAKRCATTSRSCGYAERGPRAARDTGEREEVSAQLVVRAGLPQRGGTGSAVRRRHGNHPAPPGTHRRPPQRVRRRLDQARSHRCHRHQ
jgi:ferredoxin--NADP+ reductase